mmetsp:Transcript_31461/g.73488  ORF Transcript_31461/g.73488 Transcript_31461/m.73488 type:complete len:426 (-) Transcript_31461:97-1374(-)|eukprot:CAMPEP_0178437028 /NCGR_PEP_ID=MMETSP0689_2-20121128/34751_1 /TAXON_ID=160604 /ORGANISM="Amphidinium massartii, Strain CS-259" /LENGTH=425 /DNA_ID=CAMNT_0020059157 /DNA_START=132 /DNA_END=1409 /DNA_ORIENTATION=+
MSAVIAPGSFRIGASDNDLRPMSSTNMQPTASTLFDVLDQNHDGVLTKDELSKIPPPGAGSFKMPPMSTGSFGAGPMPPVSTSSFGPPQVGASSSSTSHMRPLDKSRVTHGTGGSPPGSMQSTSSAPASMVLAGSAPLSASQLTMSSPVLEPPTIGQLPAVGSVGQVTVASSKIPMSSGRFVGAPRSTGSIPQGMTVMSTPMVSQSFTTVAAPPRPPLSTVKPMPVSSQSITEAPAFSTRPPAALTTGMVSDDDEDDNDVLEDDFVSGGPPAKPPAVFSDMMSSLYEDATAEEEELEEAEDHGNTYPAQHELHEQVSMFGGADQSQQQPAGIPLPPLEAVRATPTGVLEDGFWIKAGDRRVEPHWMDTQWWLTAPVDFKGLERLDYTSQQNALDLTDYTVRVMDNEGQLPPLPRYYHEGKECPIS